MEIFAGTKLHKMSDRRPAEEFTLFEPLANAVNWTDVEALTALRLVDGRAPRAEQAVEDLGHERGRRGSDQA